MRIFKKPFGFGNGKKKRKNNIPNGLWTKCRDCSHLILAKILTKNSKVCPKCSYHFSLTCWERKDLLVDAGTFREESTGLTSRDPLNFFGAKTYKEKLKDAMQSTGLKEAAIIGSAKMDKKNIALGITDSRFIMGSMGSVVGEKIARITEKALEERIPLIVVSGSGGGARMYEGMFSLMQMAKTSAVLSRLKRENIPFISVLTHPTMAGVIASFAGLGDITIAEPGALIGFTGPRIIKQTIKQDLPKGFQTSEFNLEHGFIDMVIPRKELRNTIIKLLHYLT